MSGVEASQSKNMTSTIAAMTSSAESVKIHPLVILNISDHFTRTRAQLSQNVTGASGQRPSSSSCVARGATAGSIHVYGALYGKQDGRKIEIITSFELALYENKEKIDMEYFTSKAEKFREVFGDLEFLGWYTTGGPPDATDSEIHHQFTAINENPVFLKLSPLQSSASELPLTVWEGCINASEGEGEAEQRISFMPLTYSLATDEAERIGVDHVARVSTVCHTRKTTLAATAVPSSGTGNDTGTTNNVTVLEPESTIEDQYMGHHSAVKMLHSRVRLILDYVCAVQNGQLGGAASGGINQEILRDINSLCHTLPLISSDPQTASSSQQPFATEFHQQYNEVALLSFLGTLMKGCNTINQYAQKFSKVHDRPLGSQQAIGSSRVKPRIYYS